MIRTTRKAAFAGLALTASAILLAGCGAPPEEAPETTDGAEAPAESSDFLACAVSDEGSWNDKSFNEAAYAGLQQAESELGIQIDDAESASAEDFVPNLTAMVDNGCDITFAIGFNFSLGGENGVIFDVAADNPDAKFAWLDGWPGEVDNVKPIMYATEQSSYLAGYLSAAYSTSKVVGTYGGLQIDSVTSFMDGFYQGAKKYEEETGTPVKVVGWDPTAKTGDFVGDFANTEEAKSISNGQLAAGADVIFPVAGGRFTATAEAIREGGNADAVMLGVDKDIAVTQPDLADITLTSVEKRMTQAVFDIIGEVHDDEFSAEPYFGTLENDGTGLSDFGAFADKVPADVVSKLDELKQQIIDGDIEITLTKN